MQIKAILFDIDGTLVDSNDMHVLAWQEVFANFGAPFDRLIVHNQIGKGTDMLVPALLPGIDEATREQLGNERKAIFNAKFLSKVLPFREARELLEHVQKRGQKVMLASSASASEIEHYLDLLDAHDLVAAKTSSDDVEHTKPAPDIFTAALSKLSSVTPSEAIVVGDTPYDMEAADKSKIAAVGVRSGGFSDEVLKQAGAIAIYDDVAALLANYESSPLAS